MADGVADELAKLAALRDAGNISPAEYEAQKQRLLAPAPRPSTAPAPAPAAAPKKEVSKKAGCLTVIAFVAVLAIIGAIIGIASGGSSASYKATIESVNALSSSQAGVTIQVTNTGSAAGAPTCTIQLNSPNASDTGIDVVTFKSPIAKGQTATAVDTITVTNNGAANVTVGASSVSC